jgi:uncharacterized membrane protein
MPAMTQSHFWASEKRPPSFSPHLDDADLGLLGAVLRAKRRGARRIAFALGAALGVTALDALTGKRLRRALGGGPDGAKKGERTVERSITIQRSPDEVYRFWRHLENLPRFMANIESVTQLEGNRSHWKVRAPAGTSVEWDAEIIEDVFGERLSWQSVKGADVENVGAVHLKAAPKGRGTEVRVHLRYEAPAGPVGVAVAKLFGKEPGQQASADLRRLKQVLETGQVVHSDATVRPGPHPARPSNERRKVEELLDLELGPALLGEGASQDTMKEMR